MNRLCTSCPGALTGDCRECGELNDPRGGDYDEDALDEEPERDEEGEANNE